MAGFPVQYFAAVETQRRLAPHLHAAIRGAIPRAVFRQVVAATYHQVWWPPFDQPVYGTDAGTGDGEQPVWSDGTGYVDPVTGAALPTWAQALDRLDADLDADPGMRAAHVVRFANQFDVQGLVATQVDTPRRVAYLTKSVADTYGSPDDLTTAQTDHLDALAEQVRWLPCSPRCWNWLRYGVQPLAAAAGMEAGRCPGKAHRRENLGCGGRRVLVSRKWTGKTLAQHQADRAAVVREALAAAGVDMVDADRMAADQLDGSGRPRYVWTALDVARTDPGLFRQAVITAIRQRQRWRAQYAAAKAREGPPGGPEAAIDHEVPAAGAPGRVRVVEVGPARS